MNTYSTKERFDYFLKCEIADLSFLITSGTFFFPTEKEVSRNAERFRIMKANCSYNSRELRAVCGSLNMEK